MRKNAGALCTPMIARGFCNRRTFTNSFRGPLNDRELRNSAGRPNAPEWPLCQFCDRCSKMRGGILPICSIRQEFGRLAPPCLRRLRALGDIPQPHDVPRQADLFHQPDHVVRDVDFPPAVALAGDALIGVVVVVPTLAERQQADPPQVAAVVGRFVAARSPTCASPS